MGNYDEVDARPVEKRARHSGAKAGAINHVKWGKRGSRGRSDRCRFEFVETENHSYSFPTEGYIDIVRKTVEQENNKRVQGRGNQH